MFQIHLVDLSKIKKYTQILDKIDKMRICPTRIVCPGCYFCSVFSDQPLSIALSLYPSACCALSEDFRLLDCNADFERITGKTATELIGLSIEDVLGNPLSEIPKLKHGLGKKYRFISHFILDGEEQTADCTLQLVPGSKHVLLGFETIEKKEGNGSELAQHFQAILNNTKTWFWKIHSDYTIIELSDNFEKITGIPPSSILFKPVHDLFDFDLSHKSKQNSTSPFDMKKTFSGLVSRIKKGENKGVTVSTNAVAIQNKSGEFDGFIGCTSDITEEHAIQEELNDALDRLTTSNENLEQFAVMASHDLQEPARLIHSYVKLITMDKSNQISPKSAEFLSFLQESSERMRSLIHNILDYSNLKRGSQEKEWFSSSDILSLAKLSCTKIIHESKAEITVVDLPELIYCYPNQLSRVFQNLFSNSIKFAHPFEVPKIEITSIQKENKIELMVSDNGIGIPKKDRLRVFNMFTSLHSNAQYRGHGIGMHIVKKIIDNHKGKVELSESSSGGTMAKIILPFPT